jgi:hypothetical protein
LPGGGWPAPPAGFGDPVLCSDIATKPTYTFA